VPWLIALATVVAQFVGYVLLYQFAARILVPLGVRGATPSRALRIQKSGWGTRGMFMTGGIVGMPPLLALFALYGSKRVGPLPELAPLRHADALHLVLRLGLRGGLDAAQPGAVLV